MVYQTRSRSNCNSGIYPILTDLDIDLNPTFRFPSHLDVSVKAFFDSNIRKKIIALQGDI